ncbi:TonB-dependent receptor [Pseudoxanthomonas sp. SGD-10]|nr:TonB-dependent receptor [Pseudoxanthomonas sp. SGD-10]
MQNKHFLLIGIFLLSNISASFAQNVLSGKITDENGVALPGALISITQTKLNTIANSEGIYVLKNIPQGKQTVLVSAVGMKAQTKELLFNTGQLTLHFRLEPNVQQMETVSVIGRSKVQEANRQAYNITAIDAKELYNTTLDISGALDKVSGVRVRESGGVGSSFNFSLNGFSGNRIRFFIDGVPMDDFGSSFQINNIPINLAERIEVYKGVVPIWLGSDALGGAVNIITGNGAKSYLDASYSFGSFNTHRSVVNAAMTNSKSFTFQINAFQNYSDNNYRVKVDASDIYTGAYANTYLRRFHDTYHNETLIANTGVVNKKYADQLLVGITLGKNYKEIQTGARMVSVFGGWHRRGNIVMPHLKYRKENLIKGLDVALNANYNLGDERNIDTLNVRYDWYGNYKPNGSNGERSRSLYKYRNNNGLATAMLNYRLSDRSSLALNNTFNTFNRKGADLINNDPQNNVPRKLQKNVLGIGYSYNEADKYSINLFTKYLHQLTAIGNGFNKDQSFNRIGFGTAATYFLSPDFQLKASYERANRMPEPSDVFGDVENTEGNPNLLPEVSNNINVGASYGFSPGKNHHFSVNANGIYRYATDFIYYRLNQNQSRLIPDNRKGVMTYGGDMEVRYSYKTLLSAGMSATYQHLLNMQKTEPGYSGVSPLYKDQMPNIPYFFGNADISVNLADFGKKGNHLTIGYNMLFVHEFYLYWPSMGEGKYNIPQQISHDVNMVYSLKNSRFNIGLEVKNLTDALLYDNFSLQKPSRGFYLNLRYFIKNNHNN